MGYYVEVIGQFPVAVVFDKLIVTSTRSIDIYFTQDITPQHVSDWSIIRADGKNPIIAKITTVGKIITLTTVYSLGSYGSIGTITHPIIWNSTNTSEVVAGTYTYIAKEEPQKNLIAESITVPFDIGQTTVSTDKFSFDVVDNDYKLSVTLQHYIERLIMTPKGGFLWDTNWGVGLQPKKIINNTELVALKKDIETELQKVPFIQNTTITLSQNISILTISVAAQIQWVGYRRFEYKLPLEV